MKEKRLVRSWCPLLVVFRMECYKSIVSLAKDVKVARGTFGVYFLAS
jgi:hypothetical protein